MKRSEKQIEASRLNGAKSRGPITPEGKLRSCQNAIRHDAIAHSVTLEMEDPSIYRENLDDLCGKWQPADLTEHKLVESMATALWKKDRYELAEKVALDQRIDIERDNVQPHVYPKAAVIAQAVVHMTDRERTIRSLNHTVALLDRQYIRALNMLMKVQEYRRRLNPGLSPAEKPSLKPVEMTEPETAPMEPVTVEPEAPAEAPAATDVVRKLTTLSVTSTQKRTHNILPINTPRCIQPDQPEPSGPETGTNNRALGVAAA